MRTRCNTMTRHNIPLHHEEVDGRDNDTSHNGHNKGVDKRQDSVSIRRLEETLDVVLPIADAFSA